MKQNVTIRTLAQGETISFEHLRGFLKRPSLEKQRRAALEMFAQTVEDETQAMQIVDLYPAWEPQKSYSVGYIVKHGVNADGETQLWRVAQAHTSQANWEPEKVPALFTKIGFTPDSIPIWTQPAGGHDAYKLGDVVEHKGKRWESTANGNVWEPGVYGWKEVTT